MGGELRGDGQRQQEQQHQTRGHRPPSWAGCVLIRDHHDEQAHDDADEQSPEGQEPAEPSGSMLRRHPVGLGDDDAMFAGHVMPFSDPEGVTWCVRCGQGCLDAITVR